MSWFLAPALVTLREQINTLYPGRSKRSDGTIGDAAHSARVSDHNPDSTGMVCALDITHDPANGVDIDKLSDQLFAAKDSRVKYIIANGLITSPNGLARARWVKYSGANPHRTHIHISVYGGALGRDASPWRGIASTQNKPVPAQSGRSDNLLGGSMFARISAPGRGVAMVGPGYYRHLSNNEEVAAAGAIATKTVEGNDRQFDLWVSIALAGQSPTSGSLRAVTGKLDTVQVISDGVAALLARAEGESIDSEAIASAVIDGMGEELAGEFMAAIAKQLNK